MGQQEAAALGLTDHSSFLLLFFHTFIHPFTHPSICLSTCLSICLPVCSSVYLSTHLSVHLSICQSIYPSIHPSIGPSKDSNSGHLDHEDQPPLLCQDASLAKTHTPLCLPESSLSTGPAQHSLLPDQPPAPARVSGGQRPTES